MIISFYNEKGGVGKTTNTIHIGASLAKLGKSVLLIDFDPQVSLTKGTGINDPTYTVKNLMDGTGEVKLRSRSDNFTILAGTPELRASIYKKDSLAKVLKSWNDHFDYILIDCPPERLISNELTLPEIALNASNYFFIPVNAEPYSVNNSSVVLSKVVQIVKKNNNALLFGGFFFCRMLSTATRRNAKYVNQVKEKAPDYVFNSWIRTDTEIIEAIDDGKTIFQHKPNCRAAQDYIELTKEFIKRTS